MAAHEHLLMASAARSLRSALTVGSALTLVLLAIDYGAVPADETIPRGRVVGVPDPSRAPRMLPPEQPSGVVPRVLPSKPPRFTVPIEPKPHRLDRLDAPTRYPDVWPKLISSVPVKLTPEARRARVRGVVVLDVVITADGRIDRGRVVQPLPFGLTQAAIDAVRDWRFTPGTIKGKPVAVAMNVVVHCGE